MLRHRAVFDESMKHDYRGPSAAPLAGAWSVAGAGVGLAVDLGQALL